jgi:hypothetical protein
MPVERVGGFLEFSDLGITPSLGIETSKIDDCISEIQRRKIMGVFGCPAFGFKQDNLDFLEQIPFIIQVWFWEIQIARVDGLYVLQNLKYFGIHDKRPSIDFSRFPMLEQIVWTPIKGDKGMESLTRTKRLDLWRFRNPEKTYSRLCLPQSLETLEINWSNPIDLRQFPRLPKLKQIQFHYCRNLVSLEGVVEAFPNLEEIIITRCPNLKDYDMIRTMNLKRIYVNIRNKEVVKKKLKATLETRAP